MYQESAESIESAKSAQEFYWYTEDRTPYYYSDLKEQVDYVD